MNIFNITDFGAVADGKTDCTEAIQKALDEAGKCGGTVIVPSGEFLCGYIKVPRAVSMEGSFAWTYREYGGSILKLCRDDVPCLVDITGGFGCRLDGLSINGDGKGSNIHGVMLNWKDRLKSREAYGGKEDTPTISNCRIGNFSGDAVHFEGVWCYSIRHSMMCFSKNGLYTDGCDGFVLDCFLSDNFGAGMISNKGFMSGTFAGNRFECNHGYGVKFNNCGYLQFNGNYWDWNGLTGFYSFGHDETFDYRGHLTFVGNIFYRSGWKYSESGEVDTLFNSHIMISDACNVLINSNDFSVGGVRLYEHINPAYGIVTEKMRDSIIKDNTMLCGSLLENLVDLGSNKGDFIVKDNVGKAKEKSDGCQTFPRYDD